MAVEWIRLDTDEHPTASVVVLGWGAAPHLVDCLRSLRDSSPESAYEVIVVLNEPTGEIERRLRSEIAGVVVVSSPVNRGYGGGCNLGASRARGDYVVLLNDDAVVEEGWLDALVGAATARPDAGAVAGLVLDMDGSVQSAGCIIWADGTTWVVDQLRLNRQLGGRMPHRVDYGSGASLLVRKDVWDELGGFDERYFPAYYEDADLCLRIAARGADVVLEPRSRVRHRRSGSTNRWYRTYIAERSHASFARRWSGELARRGMPEQRRAVAAALEATAARAPGDIVVDPEAPAPAPRVTDDDYRRTLAAIQEGFPAWAEARLEEQDQRIVQQETAIRKLEFALESQLRQAREQLAIEQAAIEDARARIVDMEGSTSWRVTSLLRAVTDVLRPHRAAP